MTSTDHSFADRAAHRAWLAANAALPKGFRTGAARFAFRPLEVDKPAKMALTLIVADRPTTSFAACFTRNAFPGAPVIVGRQRLAGPTLGAVLVNNKISNVCAPGGVAASERLCAAAAGLLGIRADEVLPSSTGVIGWRLPVDAMVTALPQAVTALQAESILPAAEGIVTTDLYPKIRRADLAGGSIVGIAKGAGMIEPNLATMLVYILTDLDVGRDDLRAALGAAVGESFNRMSIDGDTSTSDTVLAMSSQHAPKPGIAEFTAALTRVCKDLTEDIVRNGEGVHHVMRVRVAGAPDAAVGAAVGKAVVNSPLFQCAVCGNDPNVGRLVAAIGREIGARHGGLDLARCTIALGGRVIFKDGVFHLDPATEAALVGHFKAAELYASVAPPDGLTFRPPVDFPRHERRVEVAIDLGCGGATVEVLGGDRSHEYISENADYRS
jgi:glutamate N-acetyltransferase/amino-acid N-acetyltransferase